MLVRQSDLCRYFVGIPERLRFPENRRVTYAILTTSGAKAVRRSAGVVAAARPPLFDERLTDTDVADLRRILGKLLRRLDLAD